MTRKRRSPRSQPRRLRAFGSRAGEVVRRADIENLIGIANTIMQVSRSTRGVLREALHDIATSTLDWIINNVVEQTHACTADEGAVQAKAAAVQERVQEATATLGHGSAQAMRQRCALPTHVKKMIIIQSFS